MKNRHLVACLPLAIVVTVVMASVAVAGDPPAGSDSTGSPSPTYLSDFTSLSRSSVGIASRLGAGSPFAAYSPRRIGYRSPVCNCIEPSWYIRVFYSRNIEMPPRGYDWFREEHWALAEALYRSALENPDREGRITAPVPRR